MDVNTDWIRGRFFLQDFLKIDLNKDRLYRAAGTEEIAEKNGDVAVAIRMVRQRHDTADRRFFIDGEETHTLHMRIRTYNESITRIGVSTAPFTFFDDDPVFDLHESLKRIPCRLAPATANLTSDVPTQGGGREFQTGATATLVDSDDAVRVEFDPLEGVPIVHLGDADTDSSTLRFQTRDRFFTNYRDALPLWLLAREDENSYIGFSLQMDDTEHFCGTGERFDRIDLYGREIDIINENAHGVNGRRSYKNVPFLMSSRPYGVFNGSSAPMKIDIGSHSSRSLQWITEDTTTDLFFIGGDDFATILRRYQLLTGIPPVPPMWSFGVWLSKASYRSATEVQETIDRMRSEGYPVDVVNLDTQWTETEWHMDWRFGPEFSPPDEFLRAMDQRDVKVCLWEFPYINPHTTVAEETAENRLVGSPTRADTAVEWGATLDFTNPATIEWYKEKLRRLAVLGVRAFKTDFGENIDEYARYHGMDGRRLHNRYALLYQKATYEVLREVHGEAVLWARPGFAGCQRYPLHWSADCSSTYDGVTESLWGGLHLGLSGFAYWSHDVGGFYDLDVPFGGKPDPELFLRWVQHGVFTSHFRFHGMSPREPWEYPDIAEAVREWLRYRMMLVPYIYETAVTSQRSGLPILRALVFGHRRDPAAWSVSDQYMFGDSFLVCPLFNASGIRDVYIPKGRWVDYWNGGIVDGPRTLQNVDRNGRPPLFVPIGSRIEYAAPVCCVEQLQKVERFFEVYDEDYPGFDNSRVRSYVAI